ncbi:MAG: hypothetical protein JSS61_00950 [Verrucomicrobia bacterium]|nr:hypothetical protein [Verrucomicrobiota bacterium]
MHDLVRDTLAYLRDPLLPREPLIATQEEEVFFAHVSKEPVREEAPPPPLRPIAPAPKPQPKPEPAFKQSLEKLLPGIKLVDSIPDDSLAKQQASAGQEKLPGVEVLLLACDAALETIEFLKTLAKAIDQHLGKTKILMAEKLETQKRWDPFFEQNAFRLVIATSSMHRLPELARYKQKLLILAPISDYKIPQNKALLWKELCSRLPK